MLGVITNNDGQNHRDLIPCGSRLADQGPVAEPWPLGSLPACALFLIWIESFKRLPNWSYFPRAESSTHLLTRRRGSSPLRMIQIAWWFFFFFKEHPPLPNMQVDVTSSQIPARVVFQPPSPMIRLDAADPIETLCGPVWGSSTARKRDQRRDLRMVVGQSHHNRISLRQIIDLHSCAFMFMLNSTSIPMLVA